MPENPLKTPTVISTRLIQVKFAVHSKERLAGDQRGVRARLMLINIAATGRLGIPIIAAKP